MDYKTRATLLDRLRDSADALAWEDFFQRYWRLIFALARRRGCSDDTAEEIVQEVMLAVYRKREVFRYDPAQGRFRDWLAAVVRNQVAQFRRQPSQRVRPAGALDVQEAEPVADGPGPQAACEATFEVALLATLLDELRRELNPATYQAFELLTLHGLSGTEVARITGTSRNAVYLARRKALRRLRELGSPYRDRGALPERIKQALESGPAAATERSLTARIEQTIRPR